MQPAAPAFEAVLYPNQPLSRSAFIAFMAAVSSIGAAIGAGFVVMGAWPVTGFFGLDVILLFTAFRVVRQRARQRELIRLDGDGLTVRRVEPDGRSRDWRFEPYWARVHMDDPPRRDSRLTIAAMGTRLSIGQFLTPEERLEVARALRAALRRYQ